MIANRTDLPVRENQSRWQQGFMAMLPDITKHARHAFRYFSMEARGEAIQEVLVSSMLAYYRLHHRGKVDLAYPSVLCRYAVAQFHQGRRTSEKSNCKDVMSPYAQRIQGLRVEPLPINYSPRNTWSEILVEDKQAGPAEIAAIRLDFTAWLASLSIQDQKITNALSDGSTTKEVAKRQQLSPGRISQKRRELKESWQQFQGLSENALA
ncbi:MAG: hypothetical protein COA78_35670 [Blastopirellula sp.]|nr:MAG: hypothetical protein COA78_35670 [Blastopirellula sp.]